MKLIILGAIGKAHGLRGELQVVAFNADSPHWKAGAELQVLRQGAPGYPTNRNADATETESSETMRVKNTRSGGDRKLVISLDGVKNRQDAEALRGAVIGVPAQALGELEPGEYWYHEVPGWEVVTSDGEPVGRVVRALATHIELLEVRPASGGETFYLPVLPHVVTDIDRDAARVTIDPLEGLLP